MFLQSKAKIIKSFNLILYFDDGTHKEVTVTEGDKLYVEFLEDGNLYAMDGVLKSIHNILDDTNEICLTVDGSSLGNCLVKHIRQSKIRDLKVFNEDDDPYLIKVMYGASGFVCVGLNYENGEEYELQDDEELKLYVRNKDSYDALIELVSPDKTNFIIPAKDIMNIGVGEFIYDVLIESEQYSIVAIPNSKFIVWK